MPGFPHAARAVPAILLTLVLALFSMRSFELSPLITLQLLLVLHPIYYWTLFRPTLFPAWLAFLLGFAIDLVAGSLLGLNAFLLVFASLVIARQRRYLLSQPFATQWAGFLLVSLAAEAIRWSVMGLVTMTVFSPASAAASAICNAALYPLTSLVMYGALALISPYKIKDKIQD
jgi:rod shape-determining protein MreD